MPPKRLVVTGFFLGIALASFAQRKRDISFYSHRIKERTALKEDADLFADFPELPFAHSDNVLPLDPNLSRVGLHQSYEMLK